MTFSGAPLVAPRHATRIVSSLVALCLGGCGTEPPLAPVSSGASAASQFSAMAFTATVDTRARSVSIAPPPFAGTAAPTLLIGGVERPALSLLGSDVVRLVPSNVRISTLGAFVPNRIRVTFDVTLENKLPSLALIAPTWPTPPAPYVIMFPLDYSVTLSPGGVAGSDGNSIGIGLPGGGQVTPSENWDGTGSPGSGAPYSFFNTTNCSSVVSNNCFRWVTFGSQVQPITGRPTRTVGFDIDASVAQFRSRMIVAADLIPATLTAP